ncbi:MAG TPA: hypothetical protein VH208_06130, partial [Myxococcaceae bacterium]|nr:hypothetical protein [Myxococcaceae bacterium]
AAAGALADRHHYATLGEPLRIELFYTGLTEATVGALDGLAASRRDCEPVLMRWNAEGGAYEPLARGGQR